MTEIEDRIRSAMQHRASTTRVHETSRHRTTTPQHHVIRWADDNQHDSEHRAGRYPFQRPRALALPAVVVLVAVGGLVAIEGWNTPPSTSTVPPNESRWDIDVIDPLAISLDTWIDPSVPVDAGSTYLVVDQTGLPDGASLTGEVGSNLIADGLSGDLGYFYNGTVAISAESSFDVRIVKDFPFPSCDTTAATQSVDIGGLVGRTDGTQICWALDNGFEISVRAGNDTSATPTELESLARTLQFVTVNKLPYADLAVDRGAPEPADIAMAGSLAGARWFVTIPPDSDRTMSVYVGGSLTSGTDESYGDGQAVETVVADLSGVPGYGALATGWTPPTATQVIVATTSGDTARVPVIQRENASFFAVPIPDSVNVSTVTFLDEDGSVVATVEIPGLPFGFTGGHGLTT